MPNSIIDDVTEQTVSIGVVGSQEGATPFNNTMNAFTHVLLTSQTPVNDDEFL